MKKIIFLLSLIWPNNFLYSMASDLHQAVIKKSSNDVVSSIYAGADINAISGEEEVTPLHLACQINDLERDWCREYMAALLLENNADANASLGNKSTNAGWTPLHSAALSGSRYLIELLLSKKANPLARAQIKPTPLTELLRYEKTTLERTKTTQTPQDVARNGNIKLTLEMAQKEFMPTIPEVKRVSWKPFYELEDVVPEVDLEQHLIADYTDVNEVDEKGFTVLHRACREKQYEDNDEVLTIDNILETNYIDNYTRVCGLLCNNADIESNTCGHTPLFEAVNSQNLDAIKLLLYLKANVNARTKKDVTPLYLAAGKRKSYFLHGACALKLLLNNKANPNSSNEDGYRPLHRACQSGCFENARMLIAARANVNARTKDGLTPLHIACQKGHTHIAQLLLKDHTTKVNLPLSGDTDNHGATPLHYAANFASPELVKLLLEYGADPEAKCKDGNTPLDFARNREIQLILEDALEKQQAIREEDERAADEINRFLCLFSK